MADKKENKDSANVTVPSGLSGQTVTTIHVWKAGSVHITEVVSGGVSTFIKWKQGQCDIGGTAEFGTGTKVF